MSLRKLTYFYFNNYSNFIDRKLFKTRVLDKYNNIKLKREKLKLGAIVFKLCEFRYNGFLLYYWFDVVYTNQSSSQYSKAGDYLQRVLNFWKWSWDFSNIFSLTLILAAFYDILKINLNLFIEVSTKLSEDDIKRNKAELKQIYSLLDFESFTQSTDFYKNFIQISDVILKVSEFIDFVNIYN